ncbi:MAG: ribosomal-processing cysteine protease Prp [Eubacterium sp.]|nr:ribosomal-processing cysteine protease Prp [Eubacterium sp.]
MIKITIDQNHAGQYTGLHCIGHAGFAGFGKDIVCAAVSVLVLNTLNAIDAFTDEPFDFENDPDSGLIDIRFQKPGGHDAKLLLDTMLLGLKEIQSQYGTDYILVTCKEV